MLHQHPHPPATPTLVSISALSDRGLLHGAVAGVTQVVNVFQYPLFRIVDCFISTATRSKVNFVSISALSDRGLLLIRWQVGTSAGTCFNIRSFGSWIASMLERRHCRNRHVVSISALSDRGLLLFSCSTLSASRLVVSISALSDRGLLHAANTTPVKSLNVSISALSDRGLLL